MSQDDRLQLRIDSGIKEGAFAVFKEIGITPSEAVRVFFMQVQKTKTLPFILHAGEAHEAPEPGYHEWLKARLAYVIKGVDSGAIPVYEAAEARAVLKQKRDRIRARQKAALPITV